MAAHADFFNLIADERYFPFTTITGHWVCLATETDVKTVF